MGNLNRRPNLGPEVGREGFLESYPLLVFHFCTESLESISELIYYVKHNYLDLVNALDTIILL